VDCGAVICGAAAAATAALGSGASFERRLSGRPGADGAEMAIACLFVLVGRAAGGAIRSDLRD
jgi:hypothetical protein